MLKYLNSAICGEQCTLVGIDFVGYILTVCAESLQSCEVQKVQSLILLLKHTRTNIQTCSPSLQPWEWRMLRFKVISSIQQPGALHCQCTTSFCSHMHSDAHTNVSAHTHMHAQTVVRHTFNTPHLTNTHIRDNNVSVR